MDGGVDGGAWWAAVHGVAKSRTWLSDFFHFSLSRIGEGNGNPLQCSRLENPRDRGAWWADVYGDSQSQTWLKWLSSSSSKLAEQRLQYTWQIIYLVFTELVQKVVKQTTISCRNNLQIWFLELPHCFCSPVAQSCLTLCSPLDYSMPGFPVLHHLPEVAQTHDHWISDAIQPPHPLSSPSPPAFNLSQCQALFQWVSSSQVAEVLELQLQHQSSQWIFRIDFLNIHWKDWLVWSSCCPSDSQKSFPAPQFQSINSLALSLLFGPTLTSVHDYWENHSFDHVDFCQQSAVSAF